MLVRKRQGWLEGKLGTRFCRVPAMGLEDAGGGGGASAPKPDEDGVIAEGDTLKVPKPAFLKIKERAEAKGREAVQADLAQKAKAAGYDSVDALLADAPRLKARVGELDPKVAELTKAREDLDRKLVSTQQEKDALAADKVKLDEALKAAQTEAKAKADALAEQQSRAATREAAILSGFVDPDYAEHLVKQHIASLKPEDALKFDRAAFFADMKKSRPALFAAVGPATTGHGAQGAPPPPSPGNASKGGALPPGVLGLSDEEYAARRRAAGIRTPVM